MKGIAHFVTGVGLASFFPGAVQAAADGNPLYFILGGAFGLMPDTLDFKFYRFFYRHDLYVDPDPREPDPQAIADALAAIIGRAAQEKRSLRIKLNTLMLGADYWQQYVVKFDDVKQEVLVWFGPVVNTGQVPVPGTTPEKPVVGRARLPCPIRQTYEAITTVDVFDGPSFSLVPESDGRVAMHFLPWHRGWSHSLLTGAFFAAIGGWIWGWQAAAVIQLAFSGHVIEDQFGYMGSNLFWPVTRRRFKGLACWHAGDSWPNFLCVWLNCLLIFWNLDRFGPPGLYQVALWKVLLFGAVIPIAAYKLIRRLLPSSRRDEPTVVDLSREFGDSSSS